MAGYLKISEHLEVSDADKDDNGVIEVAINDDKGEEKAYTYISQQEAKKLIEWLNSQIL